MFVHSVDDSLIVILWYEDKLCILIAMSSYLCVWIGICTAIIEQPSDLWSYAQLLFLCAYVYVHINMFVLACVCTWVVSLLHIWVHCTDEAQ